MAVTQCNDSWVEFDCDHKNCSSWKLVGYWTIDLVARAYGTNILEPLLCQIAFSHFIPGMLQILPKYKYQRTIYGGARLYKLYTIAINHIKINDFPEMKVPNISHYSVVLPLMCAWKFGIVRNGFELRECVRAFLLISCVGADMSLLWRHRCRNAISGT